jgi:hypothetical protein
MRFGLTPDMLEAAYEYLRASKPFRGMKLPHPDDLVFRVSRHADRFAHFWAVNNNHWELAVSEVNVDSTLILLPTMAHEMIHLYQEKNKLLGNHNEEFMRVAKLVCRYHKFDLTTFV